MELELEHVACPLCRADEPVPVMQATDVWCGVPGVFHVVRCQVCRHVYMNPRPDAATVALCYPAEYAPHRVASADETAPPDSSNARGSAKPEAATGKPWYLSRGVRMIPGLRALYYWLTDFRTEFIPAGDGLPGRALEVGCAGGGMLMRLRDAGWTAEGVELMPAPAAAARARGFEVSEGTLEDAEFASDRYDAVFAWMVLEHLADPCGTLHEVHRILRPDGWLVFSVPNFDCWERFVFRGYWLGLDLPRHLQHFGPRSLRRVLTEARFDRVRVLHQRNLGNIVASIGLWLRARSWGRRAGQRLIDFVDNPTMWLQLLLALPARVPAFFRQGGRLTVVARASRRNSDDAAAK